MGKADSGRPPASASRAAGRAGAGTQCDRIGVMTAPSRPIAVFLPLSRLPIVSPERAVDLADRLRLGGRAGRQDRAEQLDGLAQPIGLRRAGRRVRQRPLRLELLDQDHQPLEQRDESVGPGRDGTGPVGARNLRSIAAIVAASAKPDGDRPFACWNCSHRRHRQRSVQAVLSQRRVGAERVERLLHPQGVVRHGARARHGYHGHVGADDDVVRDQPPSTAAPAGACRRPPAEARPRAG